MRFEFHKRPFRKCHESDMDAFRLLQMEVLHYPKRHTNKVFRCHELHHTAVCLSASRGIHELEGERII